jgi:hypothetical protein
MRKIAEFLKVSWPHFIALIAALGGVPGIAFLWDRIHPAPIASTPPIAAVPLPAKPPTPPKKKIETGSLRSKADPEPNFFEHPWDWLLWNQRRFQPKCDSNAKDDCGQ